MEVAENWEAQAEKARASEISRRDRFREWVDKIDEGKQLWQLAEAAKNQRTRQLTFTSNLKTPNGTQHEDAEEKGEISRDTFSPKAKPAVLDDTTGYLYPEPAPFSAIKKWEVEEAIKTSNADKVAGPDGLSFRVWQACLPQLTTRLDTLNHRRAS